MCQEVFQIAMGMDLKSVEMQLALQCAPLITGARISNMLMIDSVDESAMRVILPNTYIFLVEPHSLADYSITALSFFSLFFE